MRDPPRLVLRFLALLFGCAAATAADGPARRFDCDLPSPPAPAAASGRLLVLPGVGNTRFHLAGFVAAVERQLPHFEIEVRAWGKPFLALHNLRAHERNVATAASIAAELAAWRRAHPSAPLYVVGYSGGGGMATLVTAALPDGVQVDRLVLVAPAISPHFPLERDVLPHVREYVVNFASERDLQVGWGTQAFGTIDRQNTPSAGATGFAVAHEQLLEHRWSNTEVPLGHAGNHLAYWSGLWQAARLLPVLDPSLDARGIRERWARTCRES